MATTFNEGDRVRIVDREPTEDDQKSSLYFNHYRGLVGSVQKVYAAANEVAITVDEDSLTDTIRNRHHDVRDAMKQKWLDGLSEEAKGRLTDAERNFQLRYTVCVAPNDLVLLTAAEIEASKATAIASVDAGSPRRKTAAEIEADEEEYLKSRQTEGQA